MGNKKVRVWTKHKSMRNKKKILLLMGGISPEREISIQSGNQCKRAILNLGYDLEVLDPDYDIVTKLVTLEFDIVFNCLHGSWGENGKIQSILEFLNLNYTHSGVMASSRAMNKVISKEFFKNNGIPVAKDIDFRNQINNLTFPFIVKPINGGSSLGIKIIKNSNELNSFRKDNDSNDEDFFAEEFVTGMDFTCGVIGQEVTHIAEIQTKSDYFGYKDKYISNNTKHIIPANLKPNVYERMREYALKAHNCLGCRGVSRVDFRYGIDDRGEKLVCLEVNTQPGMTEKSLLPELAEYSGISFDQLVDWIIYDASLKR